MANSIVAKKELQTDDRKTRKGSRTPEYLLPTDNVQHCLMLCV